MSSGISKPASPSTDALDGDDQIGDPTNNGDEQLDTEKLISQRTANESEEKSEQINTENTRNRTTRSGRVSKPPR